MRDSLIVAHLPVAQAILRKAERRLPSHLRNGELMGAVHEALVKAAEAYNPERGVSFTAYLQPRIRGAILDELRRRDHLSQRRRRGIKNGSITPTPSDAPPRRMDEVVVADGREMTLHDLIADLMTADIRVALDQKEIEELVANAIGHLPEQLRFVIKSSFYDGMSGDEIGAALGVTDSRVSQLKAKAFERLGVRLKGAVNAVKRISAEIRTPAPRACPADAISEPERVPPQAAPKQPLVHVPERPPVEFHPTPIPVADAADEDFRLIVQELEHAKARIRELESAIARAA